MLSKPRLLCFLLLSLRFLSMGLGRSLAFATPVAKLNDLNHVNNLVFRLITPCKRIRNTAQAEIRDHCTNDWNASSKFH